MQYVGTKDKLPLLDLQRWLFIDSKRLRLYWDSKELQDTSYV